MREFPSFGFTDQAKDRVAVILAGGEGSRLKSLTRVITGDERPKQFCPILKDRTLLDETRQRVSQLFSADRIYYSLTAKHEKYYDRLALDVPASRLVIQPENTGTAPAILYSLLSIAKGSPDATVSFFPSDHYFANEKGFIKNVKHSIRTAELSPDAITLLGIQPEKPETSYGWIEPADSLFGEIEGAVTRVKRFWEKPSIGVAKKLMKTGCLWNSFVMTGKVDAFLKLFQKHLPEMFRMFVALSSSFGTPKEASVLRSIYSWINETNFSSEVLERSAGDLLVMRVSDVGWSDLGEPNRVLNTLAGLGIFPDWIPAAA
jgi:mannose-1-phosphate guanylyltransferase